MELTNEQKPQNRELQAKQLQKLFNEKVIDLFLKECQELMQNGVNLKQFSEEYKLENDMEEQYHSMKRVLFEAERMITISQTDQEGFKTIQVDENCTLSVRSHGTVMELKSKGRLQLNFKHMLIVPYLIKHYKQCFPFCKQAMDIQQPTKLQKIGFIRLSLPIPLVKDRSCILRGIGFQCHDKPHKAILFAEGVTQNKQFIERHKIDREILMRKRELLDFRHFAVELKCLGEKLVEYTGYALLDHHIAMLPQRLVMYVTKEMGKYLFNKVMKELKTFEKTIWGKQMKQNYQDNAFYYQWIQQLVNRWLVQIENQK